MSNSLKRLPAFAAASRPMPGHKLLDLASFGFVRDFAGADQHGYNAAADILVYTTVDGIDYNEMFSEYQQTVALQNAERQAIVDFFSFSVIKPSESVSQLSASKFERSTEFGEPRGLRQKPTVWSLGYDFDWYDLAIRYTWRFLADATQTQVDGLHASALEADNRLVFEKVLEALYNNTNREAEIDGRDVNVYALYNADGTVPPTYKSNVFDGTHNHYLVSGGVNIDSGDLDALYEHLRHHGYGAENGIQQVVAVNSREGKIIRTFRIATGSTYDFIPAQGQPTALILDLGQSLTGTQVASTYKGLNVIGAYGNQLIVEDDLFPAGYVVNIGSGGRDNLNNPVGIREHTNASLRGLRLVKGANPDYPLIDSFYQRGIGTGIRQRGGSVVMQIKATGSYVPPTQYLF